MTTRYTLRCSLENSEPEIWRRLELPGDLDLDDLPGTILLAMGWEGTEEYSLSVMGADVQPYQPDSTIDDLLSHD